MKIMVDKIYNMLIQYKFFRNLYISEIFILDEISNKWFFIKDLKPGMKVIKVDGKWNSQCFCECGNELIHSNSFIEERVLKHCTFPIFIYDYKCNYCRKEKHFRPDIAPCFLSCDINGNIN
jgi:hypothetical protein